jgi:hypothetical protein
MKASNQLLKISSSAALISSFLIAASRVNCAENSITLRSINTTVPNKSIQAWYEEPGYDCWKTGRFICNPLVSVMPIGPGGQIYTNGNTKVTIICPDKQNRFVLPGHYKDGVTINELCKSPPNSEIGPRIGNFRSGGFDPSIPYIVSPRYSLLRSQQPLLRWNTVPGARKYTVSLFDDRSKRLNDGSLEPICTIQDVIEPSKNGIVTIEFNRCRTTKTAQFQSYQLESGHFYRIKVDAHLVKAISSDEEPVDRNKYKAEQRGVEGIEFKLISPQREEEVAASITEITQELQGKEERLFSIASIYDSYNRRSSRGSIVLQNLVR